MTKTIYSIILCGFISQLHAQPYQKHFQVGQGYDCNRSEIKTSPFENFEIVTKKMQQNPLQKIVRIRNFDELLTELNIEKTFAITKNKKIQKLLDNSSINDYTITYLIHVSNTHIKHTLQSTEIDINSSYIDSIDIGGEFIALIHIKTHSLNDYNKIKKMKVSWEKIDKFEEQIKSLSDKNIISVKNIITSDDTIYPVNEFTSVIQNAKTFAKDIINHEVPYKAHITKQKQNMNQPTIEPYLEALQAVNNLEYIRRNPEQFSYKNSDITPTIESEKLSIHFNNLSPDNMSLLKKMVHEITLPQRHNACKNHIKTEPTTITLQSKNIEKRYPKILEDRSLSVNYDFKLDLQNKGKIVLLSWTKTVKESNTIIHKEQNRKILLDSYINFKDLKATQITGSNYGNIYFSTKFDSYEKHKAINGTGIINSANCGYKIIDKEGSLEIECQDIKLRNLDIEFKHIE